jgi:uncharacterized protein YyaL (SSP411 family)
MGLLSERTTPADASSAYPTLPAAAELATFPPDGGPQYNRLVFEQSPYLLQHATNPIDWYPSPAATLQALTPHVASSPPSHTLLLSALDFALGPSFEVVVSGVRDRADTRAMMRALRQPFLPNKVVVFRPGEVADPAISRVAP